MALFIPTIIITGIYAGIVNTISSATVNTCSIIKNIYNLQNPDTNVFLQKLDIERKLCLIQSVIKTLNIPIDSACEINLNDLKKSEILVIVQSEQKLNINPLALCLKFLQDTIQKINHILTKIDTKVKYHNTMWFSNWRTLNVKSLLDELEINSKLLSDRFDDLTKIIFFMKNN